MALTESDALRLATALDDYELVKVTDIRGIGDRFEIAFTDQRFDTDYVITSNWDYWDFIGYLTGTKAWPALKPVPREAKVAS